LIFSYLGSEHAGFAQELVERISYGAAKELLPIIKIKGIGRVRARNLYNAGYKDIEAIRKAEFKALADSGSSGLMLMKNRVTLQEMLKHNKI